ncbi:MAG: hypothetical protein A3H98_00830 [Bacteroidetes bacterium RIFCSPLOWO2_02_FULL_36_8]|nr:MAG: hypothetical protein A3H98_00830 [Bacteroidetes bacterium RIFCSPLOWO2_02_FULL_36_8]OFY72066.1 MAG: hypothetical protein A3G23_06785 [Bacteroidetes bacterium RIFCSPLOWO2_12_FULL_37_12]
MYLLFYPLLWISARFEYFHPFAYQYEKFIAKLFLVVPGIYLKKDFRFKPSKKENYIYCPNHTSFLDIIVSYAVLPGNLVFVGKASLKKVPLFGAIYRRLHIIVDRESKINSARAALKSLAHLEKGNNLVIFPEGTINHSAPALGKFKDGPFVVALEKKVKLVPVTFPDNRFFFPDDKKFLVRPGFLRVVVHEPIDCALYSKENLAEIKEKVWQIMQLELNKDNKPF